MTALPVRFHFPASLLLRTETVEKGTGNLESYAFIHGLIPRLGFFKGNEKRLPWDFDDVLALIAPRPLMVVAPQFDQDATWADGKQYVERSAARL